MAATRGGRLSSMTIRRSYSSPAPSTSHLPHSVHHPPLPSFITPRLAELRKNILDQLSGRDRIPAFMRLRQACGDTHSPTMETMARMYFDRGGKLFRPTIALLMASACNQEVASRRGLSIDSVSHDITTNQARIALIAEMIHVASLVHDDIIDEADTRRGAPSVNGRWGNKMAVLAGDFILSRATQALCAIRDPTVISTMATIIEDLVVGEFLQMSPQLNPRDSSFEMGAKEGSYSDRLSLYISKSERKTASLFANSCRSVAMLADGDDSSLHESATTYGRHLGLAFQLVDDALDYEADETEDIHSSTMGKPVGIDLEQGLLTGPLLLSVGCESELKDLIGGFGGTRKRSYRDIREFVRKSGAVERTRALAAEHAERAALVSSKMRTVNGAKEALSEMALAQLERRL